MFFGLTNSPATFQNMMNDLFKELIDSGSVEIYLDDILIGADSLEELRKETDKVLEILSKNDLYLKPEKCEFEREKIEYLGVIISKGHVEMDPAKVSRIIDWPEPKTVKEVQAFLGFCNFYRRFIKDFSHLAQPLFALTRKDAIFNWADKPKKAFEEIKRIFTSAPVLAIPDTQKPFRIECDSSDYATGAVLAQLEDDNLWHPVAYLSKSLAEAERNYDIHDKELLAIIRSLDAWRHYLEGCKHKIKIWTDHRNLEYFQKAQNLSRRQARGAQFLTRFDFSLEHKPGKTNKADGLSRRIDHREGVESDNQEQTLLPGHLFSKSINVRSLFIAPLTGRGHAAMENKNIAKQIRVKTKRILDTHTLIIESDNELKNKIKNSTELDDIVSQALDTIRTSGPRAITQGLKEWNFEDGLILYRGKIYVPKNIELRREVVKSCHDPAIFGHPGRYKTLEIVQRNFWWPGMSIFIKNFVEGCTTCQETKNITHPTREPLHPTEIPDTPFETITMDFITDLPPSNGHDTILVCTDKHTKTIILAPCTKTIDALGTAKLLIETTFRRYGTPKKVISDRGPQFVSQVMKTITEGMGIRMALSTAYHPQTDGATEQVNQELEQYLQAYCNRTQNDWADLLPYTELSHNTRTHSATQQIPFQMLHGFLPHWSTLIKTNPDVPAAHTHLKEMEHAKEEAKAAAQIAAETMKRQHDRFGSTPPDFQPGDLVWLDGKNLALQYEKTKLAPKRFGPFQIEKPIGPGSYCIKLPESWKIHPVFHSTLLLPYKETTEHGDNYTQPPPDIINDHPEHEVEAIINVKRNRRYKKEDEQL